MPAGGMRGVGAGVGGAVDKASWLEELSNAGTGAGEWLGANWKVGVGTR